MASNHPHNMTLIMYTKKKKLSNTLSIGLSPIVPGCEPIGDKGNNTISEQSHDTEKQELIIEDCGDDITCTTCNTSIIEGNTCYPYYETGYYTTLNCSSQPVARIICQTLLLSF